MMRSAYSTSRKLFLVALLTSLSVIFFSTTSAFGGDKENLQGTWKLIYSESGEGIITEGVLKVSNIQIVILGNQMLQKVNGNTEDESTYYINPDVNPKEIDTENKDGVVEVGIYLLEEDQLTLCYSTINPEHLRPNSFVTSVDSGSGILIFQREKP